MKNSTTTWKIITLAMLCLAAILAVRVAWRWMGEGRGNGPAPLPRKPIETQPFRWPELDARLWRHFRSGEHAAPVATAGELAARYRLAGVFLVLMDDSSRDDSESRCAILDDLQNRQQHLAVEDEWVGEIRVVRVERDYVVLSDGEREETIVLAAGSLEGGTPKGKELAPGMPTSILEQNRFGNRVGETRWEFSRKAVLEYYQEMMDDPERLASLFLAMEPDRDEEGGVAGYRLNMSAGEKDFYSMVGFENGDIIRRVNSMRMTSQRRAEYFIGEFVQNRLGAVVIDIERNGEAQKLIYLVQ